MDNTLREALETKLDTNKAGLPYATNWEYLQDLRALISLYLIVLVSFKSAARENGDGMDGNNFPGTYHTSGEAVVHVGDYPAQLPIFDEEILLMLRTADAFIRRRAERSKELALPMEHLRRVCGESDFTYFCLLCAICCSMDRGFEELFVSLHGREDLRYPTIGVADSLYRLGHSADEMAPLDLPASLARIFFEEHTERLPHQMQPLILRRSVREYILGNSQPEVLHRGLLLNGNELEAAHADLDRQVDSCLSILADNVKYPRPRLVVLTGAAGSGKKTTLRMVNARSDHRFFLLSFGYGAYNPEYERLLAELLVRSRIYGEHLCFSLESADDISSLYAILSHLAPHNPCVFLLTDNLRRNLVPEGYLVHQIRYSLPDLAQAIRYWEQFAAGCGVDEGLIQWHELASKYMLTPGRIKAGIESALAITRTEGVPLDRSVLDRAVLLGNSGRLSEIADPIPAFYTWDDLVLGDAPKGMLRDVCNRIKYRHVVENTWGFGQRSAYGNGISILLYGPPGTGKTMSAQVLAGELGLPLYRINLSQMISKYIGETAKNLDSVFREAKSSNVILFFDEADALFAKRTDVKNSNDRHANSESAYLLQKIEEYTGISILATNLAHNFDEAFRRRIQYMINIPLPSAEERQRLWQAYAGKDAPLAPDVDFELLAKELELSGSVIKSAVLQAAYFAAAEGIEIGMAHIVRAVQLELGKLGKSEPHFMGRYKNAVYGRG